MRAQLHAPAILSPRKEHPKYPFGRDWVDPTSRFRRFEDDKNVWPLQEIKPWIFHPVGLRTNTDWIILTPGKNILSFHILVLLPRISQVPGSSRGSEASYPYVLYCFPYSLHSQIGTVPEHNSDSSLPHVAFKFATHDQFHGSTLRA